MSREIQVEILDPCVMPGEEFSVTLQEGAEEVAVYRYSIINCQSKTIVVQSGETEETVWETIVPVEGHYYILVEATFGDGSQAKVTEPLRVCKL